MNEQPSRFRVGRILRRSGVIVLLLIAVVLIVRTVLEAWATVHLQNVKSSVESQYGMLNVIVPSAGRLSNTENRARIIAAAGNLTVMKDYYTWGRWDGIRTAPDSPPLPVAELTQIADENRAAIDVAKQAWQRPKSNWYQAGASDMVYLSDLLALDAWLATETGRPDDAAQAITAGFAEVSAFRSAPLVSYFDPTLSMTHASALRRLLARGEPAEQWLVILARMIEENRTGDPDRVGRIASMKAAQANWDVIEGGYVNPMKAWWVRPTVWLGRPLLRFGHAQDLEDWEAYIERASRVDPSSRATVKGSPERWWRPLATTSTGGMLTGAPNDDGSGPRRARDAKASIELAATAVALRRFRLAHSAYPATLDDLVPALLASAPIDPFTDRLPEYARTGNGFVLRAKVPPTSKAVGEWTIAR